MPIYRTDISELIGKKEVLAMLGQAQGLRNKALISFLWLTGARPSETIEMRNNDVKLGPFDIVFKITTKKLGNKKRFWCQDRTLEIRRPDLNPIVETFVNYYKAVAPTDPEGYLFRVHTTRSIQYIIEKVSKKALGKPISPYHFRHSEFTGTGIVEFQA